MAAGRPRISDLPPARLLGGVAVLSFVSLFAAIRPSATPQIDPQPSPEPAPQPTPLPTPPVTDTDPPQPRGEARAEQHASADCESPEVSPEAAGIKLSLCWSRDACEGTIRFRRSRCGGSNWGRNLSSDPLHDAWIRKAAGPDFYRVRLDGPETALAAVRFEGDCTYAAPLSVSRGGEYALAVELLYRDYEGLDEARNVWPPLLKIPVLPHGSKAAALRRSRYHAGQLTPPSDYVLVCRKSDAPAPTAACRASTVEPGRWVRLDGQTLMTKVRVKKVQRHPVLFQWSLQAEAAHEWRPDRCALPSGAETLRAARACLAKKSVGVGGDSQSRAFYFGLLNFMRGHATECMRNISEPDHQGPGLFDGDPRCFENVKGQHKHSVGDGTRLEFIEDAFLDKGCKGAKPKYLRNDITVLGFGQHPASRVHWSFAKYKRALNERVQCVQGLVAKGRRVLWLLAPKYPDTQKGYPVGVKDWRTDARLEMFNSAAREAMAPLGVPVLDLYAISAAMGHSSSDQAHYNNWVLFEFVRVAVAALCGG
eukprot:TRINITY_DN26881_c0_g1_i2.p1 TRINITY_DN26881_c0_g1~~TRINITY_DN26881_c0_g1_i2.p1  ORF type:complete len:545 (+),score=175.23 TRINITY_DN26881_c0_g1_i2:27-1637(+)